MIRHTIRFSFVVVLLSMVFIYPGCENGIVDNQPQPSPTHVQSGVVLGQPAPLLMGHSVSAQQVNLVADIADFPGARIDQNLVNAWGIAISPNGNFWVSANGTNLSVIYDKNGNQKRDPVAIPAPGSPTGGTPSGVIFNSSDEFVIPGTGSKSRFIFATEDGTIAAWSSGNSALIAADRSSFDAVYKGIAMASVGQHFFLYATNFHVGTVDVFDSHFNFVSSERFNDPEIPEGFAPFGIRNVDGLLVVTYAKQKLPDKHDDQSGPGFGYVDVFSPDGRLVRRLASQGTLNSPWGIAETEMGRERADVLLIGNFGDGKINIFSRQGDFLGQVNDDKGNPVSIDGLWGLTFIDNGSGDARDRNKLYFAAGPNKEGDGLFGYLLLR